MLNRLCVLPLTLLLALLFAPARAEVIQTFDAALHLQKDTTLDVTETITIDFGQSERHGIYRIIPVRYTRQGNSYTTPLRLESVLDGAGHSLNYSLARQGDDENIKIGDADRTVTGVHMYVLRYQVRRAVNFFGGAPEVYWNATGNEWPYAMQRVTARVYPPPGTPTAGIKTACYVGPLGATTPGNVSTDGDALVFSTDNLAPGAGLTLVAGLPAGSMTPPSAWQAALWLLADWWPLFAFPLLALGVVLFRYTRSGRDVDGGQAVAVEFSPPKDLSPAEVGTLMDERCDMQDVVSTLVDLAARGYLTIRETQSAKFLFFSNKDYVFEKKAPPAGAGPLLPHEDKFYQGLFGSSGQVTLSSLKNVFYVHLPPIRKAIYQELVDKHLFTQNPETVRSTYSGFGWLFIIGGIFLSFWGAAGGWAAYGIGVILAGLIVALAARAMPSKTALGSRALRECRGFQRFVRLAEKDRIAKLAQDDPTIFGRLLPYAMVLGVADQWADAFRDLMTTPPDWYVPYGYNGYAFTPHTFVSDLGHGMNTMGSTFSSAPSSGGSGGSGFSGGGSGGGFGGGGGGSW